jgi:hypothetical protein
MFIMTQKPKLFLPVPAQVMPPDLLSSPTAHHLSYHNNFSRREQEENEEELNDYTEPHS